MSDGARLAPINPDQRLRHVDMVRGFALFGVLLVNMFNFGATSIIWTDLHDVAASSVMRFFFETKSWRLFAFLFGFGFALQFLRVKEKQMKFVFIYIWRLLLLFCFGMANALIYDGVILMFYAEMGLLLILFWKVPPRALLLIVIGCLLVFPLQRAIRTIEFGTTPYSESFEIRLEYAQARNQELLETHPYSVGTIIDVARVNVQVIPPNPFADYYGVESTIPFFAMFLLGLYVGRKRILHEPSENWSFIRCTCYWGIGFGVFSMSIERFLHSTMGYEVFGSHRITVIPQFIGDFAFSIGSTALALGYAAGIVILARNERWRQFLNPLAAVGRMALSIYLIQALMFATLFYGYGFGQAGRIGPAMVFFYAIMFFTIQVFIANWWLNRFRFGPAEWLWRSMTYMHWQRMRI